MITLDAGQLARIANSVHGAAQLIELDFSGGLQRLTTAPVTITVGGETYTGLGDFLRVSNQTESENQGQDRLTLSLSIVNPAMVALALGAVNTYRNRFARVHLQLFDETWQPVSTKIQRWTGYMDKVSIKRSPAKDGPGSGAIELACVRAGLARFRNATGLRLTDAQQQQRFPGDRGLENMQALVEKPSTWLSKKFQQV